MTWRRDNHAKYATSKGLPESAGNYLEANYWTNRINKYLSVLGREKLALDDSSPRKMSSVAISSLVNSVLSVLVMHPKLGTSAAKSLGILGASDPKLAQFARGVAITRYTWFCASTLQLISPMLKKDAKSVLYAIAVRLLCKIWIITDWAFPNLQVSLIQDANLDFWRRNYECFTNEYNPEVLKSMENFQAEIIKFEHTNCRRVDTDKRTTMHKFEKLLDVSLRPCLKFLDDLTDLPRFRRLEINMQSILLHHLSHLMKLFSDSRSEKLYSDVTECFYLPTASYLGYSSEQRSMLRMLFRKGICMCLVEVVAEESGGFSYIKKCIECLLPFLSLCNDGQPEFMYEWSAAIKCLAVAQKSWLGDILQVYNTSSFSEGEHVDWAKKIIIRARLYVSPVVFLHMSWGT